MSTTSKINVLKTFVDFCLGLILHQKYVFKNLLQYSLANPVFYDTDVPRIEVTVYILFCVNALKFGVQLLTLTRYPPPLHHHPYMMILIQYYVTEYVMIL